MGRELAVHLVAWVLLQRPDGRVLLGRRSGVRYGAGCWGLPGGHADDRESLAAAAVREAAEEVGVVVAPDDLEAVGVQHYLDGDTHGLDVLFRARRWTGEPAPVSECSEVGWFDPADLPPDALDWLGPTLRRHLVDGEPFSEFGFPDQSRG